MTIALALGLALAPRLVVAAPRLAASPFGTPAEETPTSGGGGPAHGDREGEGVGDGEGEGESQGEGQADAEGGEPRATDEEAGPGTSLRALSCLEGEGGNDQDGARRGVQKRDFLKRLRFELSLLGGYYASDSLSSTYVYGAALSFFPSEDFGLEVLVARNPVAFRLEEAFTSFDRERHFESGVAWNFLGAMLWSPVHAKLRWSERRITHADLLLIAGGGKTAHDTVQGLTFQAGIGLKFYLARFVSVRFDVRDFIMPQEVLGRGQTTHNLITMLGLSFWVPG